MLLSGDLPARAAGLAVSMLGGDHRQLSRNSANPPIEVYQPRIGCWCCDVGEQRLRAIKLACGATGAWFIATGGTKHIAAADSISATSDCPTDWLR